MSLYLSKTPKPSLRTLMKIKEDCKHKDWFGSSLKVTGRSQSIRKRRTILQSLYVIVGRFSGYN